MNRRVGRENGFTLIELTVVMLLITLLASVAVRETSELAFQTRYEQTRERLEMIKQAILGNPRQIVNGQLAISGFAADMGRLPDNLRELLQMGYCVTAGAANPPLPAEIVVAARSPETCNGTNEWRWTSSPCTDGVSGFAACNAGGHLWLGRQIDNATGLSFGWNGPYVSVSSNPADGDAFTDGWGRLPQGYCGNPIYTDQANCTADGAVWAASNQDHNYGWYFNQIVLNSLTMLSYGKDQIYDVLATGYDIEFPELNAQPLVKVQDWMVDISGGISAIFAKRFGANSYCGFLNADTGSFTTQTQCENAGGTWSGGVCTLIDETSCKSVGGKWQSCFLPPAACAASGGTSSTGCLFSKKSCIAAAGNAAAWDTTNNICLISSDTNYCANAGGSWNGMICSFSESSCSLAGGAWVQDCAYTQAACTGAGGTWQTLATPASCAFSQAICAGMNGMSNGSDCYMSHAESVGTRYVASNCQAASGKWTREICMNVFFRDATTKIITASSDPVFVDENGAFSTQLFTGFQVAGVPINQVPAGQNAIGIYEWDGDCDPINNPFYPADRTSPIQVDFHPHATLPVVNW